MGPDCRHLIKSGFGILLDGLSPAHARFGTRWRTEVHGAVYTRFRLVLEELGPTFVKFGQSMSARRDLLPPELIAELKHFQDDMAPAPFAEVLPYVVEQSPLLTTRLRYTDPVPLTAAPLRRSRPLCGPTARGSYRSLCALEIRR